jgi:hypothetical protein
MVHAIGIRVESQNGRLNKRERIYEQLTTEYSGNKKTFFEFLAIGQRLGSNGLVERQGKTKALRENTSTEVIKQGRRGNPPSP